MKKNLKRSEGMVCDNKIFTPVCDVGVNKIAEYILANINMVKPKPYPLKHSDIDKLRTGDSILKRGDILVINNLSSLGDDIEVINSRLHAMRYHMVELHSVEDKIQYNFDEGYLDGKNHTMLDGFDLALDTIRLIDKNHGGKDE